MNQIGFLRISSCRGKLLRGLAWVGLLLLMAWVPSCTKTEKDDDGNSPVVAAEGDPIDMQVNIPPPGSSFRSGVSPSLPQIPPPPGGDSPPTLTSSGVDLRSVSPATENGVFPLSFGYLSSFEYNVPDADIVKTMQAADLRKLSDQIPTSIRKLDRKRVAISGFMVPIEVVDAGVKNFILTYSQMICCFGQMPWYNEWVFVEMPEEAPAEYQMDVPITVTGQLEVGEEIEDGYVISLYRIKGEKVVVTGDFVGKAARD